MTSANEGESCEDFASALRRDFDALEPYLPNLCGQARDWVVQIRPEIAWKHDDGKNVSGLAYCQSKLIVVGKPPWLPWCTSALRHELIHLGECPLNLSDPHRGWKDGWQSRVVNERLLSCE